MKHCFVLLLAALPLLYSCQESFSVYDTGKVVTGEASNIGAYSVILSGSIQDESLKDAEFGVVYTLHDNPDASDKLFRQWEGTAMCTTPLKGNTFSVEVKGIKSESLIYYRAFAKKGSKYIMGDVKSFTSRKISITGEEFEVSDIQTNSAKVGIKFSTDTNEDIPFAVFFIIKETDWNDWGSMYVADLGDDGYYRATIENLFMDREYEIKAEYSIIAGVSFYSNIYRFSTAGLDIRTKLLPPERIEQMYATLGAEATVVTPGFMADGGQIFWSDTATTLDELINTGYKARQLLEEGNTTLPLFFTIGPLKDDTEYYYTIGFWTTYGEKPFFTEVGSFRTTTYNYIAEPVDLGLSVKWSEFNLGATSPEEYGAYFSWGETSPKYEYNWENYKWAGSGEDIVTKYCPAGENDHWSGSGLCDDKNSLDMEDDAARVLLGGGWRIPSVAECEELLRECAISYQSRRGDWGDDIWGWKVTGPNGNSIFLPAAGLRITYISDPDFQLHNELYNAEQTYGVYQTRDAYYPPEPIFDWSAGLKILIIDCGSFTQGTIGSNYRHSGIPIRPVL